MTVKTHLITVKIAAQYPGGWYLIFLGKWYQVVSIAPTSADGKYDVSFLLNKRLVIVHAEYYEPVLAVTLSFYKRFE